MIRISKLADYGIVIMTHLARDAADNAPSAVQATKSALKIAQTTSIPQPMTSKILKQLAHANLLVSSRGAHGGYGLAHNPEDITVAAIIEALDGPIAITECAGDSDLNCAIHEVCSVRSNWSRINLAIRAALEAITLDEMASDWSTGDVLAPHRRQLQLADGIA